MKCTLLILPILFCLTISFSINAQWQKHVIDNDIVDAICVDTADLNNDSRVDLLVTLEGMSELVWYENNFPSWIKHVIDDNARQVTFAHFGDIDGDNTPDIVANLWYSKQIVLYRFMLSKNIWTKSIIDEETDNADFLQLADINGDNALDVVTAGSYIDGSGGNIIWYENKHPDWIEHIIGESTGNYPCINASDLDNDGDPDVVGTLNIEGKVVWFENQNNGLNWSERTIDDNLANAFGLNSGDVNNDGKKDILVTTGGPYFDGSKVVWYENQYPNFTRHEIDNDLRGGTSTIVTDIDGDNSNDVIVCSFQANDVVWYQAKEQSWEKHYIDEEFVGPRLSLLLDLNEDGFNDLAVPGVGSFVWYEHPGEGVESLDIGTTRYVPEFTIYPNPFKDLVNIDLRSASNYSIEITSINGQLYFHQTLKGPSHQIDLSSFQKGIYFLTVRSKDFVKTEKIIKQ